MTENEMESKTPRPFMRARRLARVEAWQSG